MTPRQKAGQQSAPLSVIEPLESRTLMSVGIIVQPIPSVAGSGTTPITASASANSGLTLHLTAGVPFAGQVAFYASPIIDPPFGLSALIAWGDGSTSNGTAQAGQLGNKFGYFISGSHTYSQPGLFKTTTTVILGPIVRPGVPPIEAPSRIVAHIIGEAIVSPDQGNSSNGVTLDERAGKAFTASVGSFTTIAPPTNLHALISWGDGTTSVGMLVPTGVSGIDVLHFDVAGTHTYSQAGTYPIHVVVTRSFLTPTPIAGAMATLAATTVVATIDSTAVVNPADGVISLTGSVSGKYTTPAANPGGSTTYVFAGAGVAGALGSVTASGTVNVPGIAARGPATGTLTLDNLLGSVTLTLTQLFTPTGAAFPNTFAYVIASATGGYFGDTGSGIITVKLGPSSTASGMGTFTFVIS